MLKNKRFFLLIILPLFLISGLSVWVEHSLRNMPDAMPTHWQHWVDPKKDSSIEEISQLPAPAWSQAQLQTPNFGYTKSVYWFKLQAPAHNKDWLLEVNNPNLDDIQVFVWQTNQLQLKHHTGDKFPFQQRPIAHQNFLLPLPATGENASTIFIRVETSGSMQVPLSLWDAAGYFTVDQFRLLGFGFYFGIMLIMGLYNLLLGMSIGDRSYMYYALFALALCLFQGGMTGFSYQFLWPNAIFWNQWSLVYAIALSLISAMLFSAQFVSLKQHLPRHNQVLNLITVLVLIAVAASSFLPFSVIIRLLAALTIPVSVSCLAVGILRWRAGDTPARFYTLAWISFLLGAILIALNKLGVIPRTFITEYAVQIGSVIEVIVLSLALGERYNIERQDKLAIQDQLLTQEQLLRTTQENALKAEREAKHQLEVRVEERTLALKLALENLAEANAALELTSRIDGLTSVKNRRYFEERFEQEWQRSKRTLQPLSLCMVDIDHFKQVNDHYGHQAGDEVLKAVAATLTATLQRPTDCVARFGGEEFSIILPGTTEEGAQHVAELLRQKVEDLVIYYHDLQIQVTISIGVSTCYSTTILSRAQFIGQADNALYEAKNNGRNQVRVA